MAVLCFWGGQSSGSYLNDVWRSTDNGETWTQVNANAEWLVRGMHTSKVMPDGSILVLGGVNGSLYYNDVWRLMPAGSSMQNPSHIYTTGGTYQVSLQAYHAEEYNSTRKTAYISVISTPVAKFSANRTSGIGSLAVLFTDHSSNSPTEWAWNFGDGSSSTLQNPEHLYCFTWFLHRFPDCNE